MLGLAAVLGLAVSGGAAAFPLIDPTNQDTVPQGTELATPDAHDLQHQLQIVNGLAAPVGGGWTFVPRIDFQEMLTDNIEQVHSNRQADFVTYFSPGFNLAGDMPRLQMVLSYAPTLSLYGRTSSLNSLTQQLYGLGTITLVPEEVYVDVRALSGVHSIYGGLGGIGTVGAPAGTGTTAQTAVPVLAGNAGGLTRNNEVQSTSFGISPYLLHNFGEWGSGKLGYSLDITRSNTLSGFASPPYPTGGTNGQTLVTNEAYGHYATGDILQFLQNSIDVDILHGQTTTDTTGATLAPGVTAPPGHSSNSSVIVTDKVSYALTHDLVVFVSAGHEDITYSNQAISTTSLVIGPNGTLVPTLNFTNARGTSIHDITWSLGGAWTPSPYSSLSVSYGHQNGFNSLSVNGYYQATARTVMTVSYGSTLGTQLDYLRNQLNLAAPNATGTLVNGQTGGSLFGATNALATQDGVFRTDTLTVGTTTSLDRDIISLSLLMAKQTSSGATSTSATSKSAGATWLHLMRPDMTVSAAIYYSIQDQSTGTFNTFNTFNPGNSTSIAASLAWQYQISDTLSGVVRYSLLERHSSTAAFDMYQNMLIFGISKTF